jgi:hypothetical protein
MKAKAQSSLKTEIHDEKSSQGLGEVKRPLARPVFDTLVCAKID